MTLGFLSVGAFGKIPSQGDFVRIQCGTAAAAALDRWLEEGVDLVRRADAQLPEAPAQFLFRAPGVREVLLGVLAPSRDAVGRRFPLAIFGALDGAALAESFPILPTAFARFLGTAAQLVVTAASTPPSDPAAAVRALPVPSPQEISIADELLRKTLLAARGADFIGRLFASAPEGCRYYAFRTFLGACRQSGGNPNKGGPTLDCPVTCDVDRLTWLELARRLLGWRDTAPSLLWNETRLLMSLGPAPPALLSYHAKPDHDGASLWPLSTTRADAIEAARGALKPAHREAIDAADSNLEALVASLSS